MAEFCVACDVEFSDKNGSLMDGTLRNIPHTCYQASTKLEELALEEKSEFAIAEVVKRQFGCSIAVTITLHTVEAYKLLHPATVKDIVGDALDYQGLQEEIDYTLDVKRRY